MITFKANSENLLPAVFLHYTHIDMKAINENCSAYHGGESKVLLSMNQMGAGHVTVPPKHSSSWLRENYSGGKLKEKRYTGTQEMMHL